MSQMMKCESCGARYDYAQEETCPKCGAYNAPYGDTHTCTPEELKENSRTGRWGTHRFSKEDASFGQMRFDRAERLHERAKSAGASRRFDKARANYRESDQKKRPIFRRILRILLIFLLVTQFILPLLFYGLMMLIDTFDEPRPESVEPAVSSALPWEGEEEAFEQWQNDLSFNTVYHELPPGSHCGYGTLNAFVEGMELYTSAGTEANLPAGYICVLLEVSLWSDAPSDFIEPAVIDIQLALDHALYYGYAADDTDYAFINCLYTTDENYAWLFEELSGRTLLDYDVINDLSGGDTLTGTAVFVLEETDFLQLRPSISFFAPANDDWTVFDDIYYIQSPLQ